VFGDRVSILGASWFAWHDALGTEFGGDLFPDCHFFDEKGSGIRPTDLVDAIFRAKLLFASKNENAFLNRSDEGSYALNIWSHKPSAASPFLFIGRCLSILKLASGLWSRSTASVTIAYHA
jgi:hypothetical protein